MALTTNLDGYYTLDSTANAAVWTNGTFTGATYVTGKIGNAADMTTTRYITMGNVYNYEYNVAWSRSFWIKYTTTDAYAMIMGKQKVAASNNALNIELAAGKLLVIMFTWWTSSICQATTNTYNDWNWHHVTITYDGSNAWSAIKFYVDWALVTSGNSSVYWAFTQSCSWTILTTDTFQINGRRWTNNSTSTFVIDEIWLWSRELTSTEVTTLYNSGNWLTYPFTTTSIKSINWLVYGSIKSINWLAIASIKKFNWLA